MIGSRTAHKNQKHFSISRFLVSPSEIQLLDANFNSGSNIDDFVKLMQGGSSITVAVDADGTADGANFSDISILEGYGTSGEDLVNLLIDNTDYELKI